MPDSPRHFRTKDVSDLYDEYRKLSEFEYLKRKAAKSRFFAIVIAAYAAAGILVYAFFLDNGMLRRVFQSKSETNADVWMKGSDKKLTEMEVKVARLDGLLTGLPKEANLLVTEKRVKVLEDKQAVLEQSILYDADKALTSRLLKQDQDTLHANINDLKEANLRLNEKLDNILLTLIVGPLLIGLIGWIWKRFVEKRRPDDSGS
ncbi:MAG TPA: hypothetical protein VLK22_00895 [Candidatus Udaeobacter sp.]|nr:hypothetical protein [Candidatus Udaeobacter sp.]